MLGIGDVNSKQAVFFQNPDPISRNEKSNTSNDSDSINISKEGMERYQSAGKQIGYNEDINDINKMGKEAWEKATGMKAWGYLESTNIAGTETSIFQKCQKSQYTIFQNYLENNDVFENMSEDEKISCISMLKGITSSMDHFGETTGYNGTSEDSVVLMENMSAQLEYFNSKYIPENVQKDFSNLISECKFFNQNSREKMFADTMPTDIVLEGLGDGLQNVEKKDIIKRHLSYCSEAQSIYQEIFLSNQTVKGVFDIEDVLSRIEKQYEKNNSVQSTSGILGKLRESWSKLF